MINWKEIFEAKESVTNKEKGVKKYFLAFYTRLWNERKMSLVKWLKIRNFILQNIEKQTVSVSQFLILDSVIDKKSSVYLRWTPWMNYTVYLSRWWLLMIEQQPQWLDN